MMIKINENMPIVFWYSNGRILRGTLHIQIIQEYPEIFGITDDDFVNTYKEYDEPLGTEGKARIVIINKVLHNGWVRVRYRTNDKVWFFEVDDFNRQERKNEIKKCMENTELFYRNGYVKVWDKKGLQFEGVCCSRKEEK